MTDHNLIKKEEEVEEEVGIIHIVEWCVFCFFFLAKWAVLSPTQFVLFVSQTSTQQTCAGTVLDAGNSELSNIKGLCLERA